MKKAANLTKLPSPTLVPRWWCRCHAGQTGHRAGSVTAERDARMLGSPLQASEAVESEEHRVSLDAEVVLCPILRLTIRFRGLPLWAIRLTRLPEDVTRLVRLMSFHPKTTLFVPSPQGCLGGPCRARCRSPRLRNTTIGTSPSSMRLGCGPLHGSLRPF